MDPQHLALLLITFGAAIVNGALGYGFSSITVPVALRNELWPSRSSSSATLIAGWVSVMVWAEEASANTLERNAVQSIVNRLIEFGSMKPINCSR